MMRSIPRSFYLILLEVLLGAFLLVRGALPALSTVDTDFPNYYTAARIVVTGRQVDRLYDDRWFQEQIAAEGIPLPGKFSPFPPVTALLFVPLAFVSPLTALRILTVLNLAVIAASVVLMSRTARISFHASLLVVLLSGIGLANCLRFGQLYILLSFSLLLGYSCYRSGRLTAAGVCFGFWIPVKYYPAALLIYFMMRREWRLLASALITACIVVALGIIVLGWDIHRQFLMTVLGGHLAGELSLQSPFSPVFQSFSSLYHALFLEDPLLHPHAAIPSLVLYRLALFGTLAVVPAIAVRSIVRVHRVGDDGSIVISLLGLLPLLLAPATATYHSVLLWLPAGLMASRLREAGMLMPKYIFGSLYAVVGFIPYSIFYRFYDKGFLVVLAYPRLIVYAAAFAAIVCYAERMAMRSLQMVPPATRFGPQD